MAAGLIGSELLFFIFFFSILAVFLDHGLSMRIHEGGDGKANPSGYIDGLLSIGDDDGGEAFRPFLGLFLGRSSSSSSSMIMSSINVLDYGANGDGRNDDTKAFERAWAEACGSSSPATVVVPEHKTFLLYPLTFSGPCRSNVSFLIKGAVEAPPDPSAWKGSNQPRHWIRFKSVGNLVVDGASGGVVDGKGRAWWQKSCKVNPSSKCQDAPTALTFEECSDVSVGNLKVTDGQQIHVSFDKSTRVAASYLAVSSPESSPNTDGVHVTYSTHVHIAHSSISTGDDCISIVSGCEHIKATDISCGPGHGISIGSLGAGASEAQVSDVLVDTARLTGTSNGVRIKTWQGGRGYARNITFRNIVMDNVRYPIIIDQHYCDSKTPCQQQKSAVEVSDVVYKNIRGSSSSEVAIDFDCSRSVPCRSIVVEDVELVGAAGGRGGGATTSFCGNVVKWVAKGKTVPPLCT